MNAKWILRGLAIASTLVSYNCKRRNNNDADNNAPVVQPPAQPGMQPGVPPGVQPGMQPGVQPGMQPGVPPGVQPGMQPGVPPGVQPGGDVITVELQRRQLEYAPGMTPVMPLVRNTLPTGGKQNYAVPLNAGHCYSIIGVGDTSVTDLDLRLYSPTTNEIVDKDEATDNYPVIRSIRHYTGECHDEGTQRVCQYTTTPLCPTASGQYRLEVEMYQGAGQYGVQVYGN